MGQRNMMCSQMTDFELDQQAQSHLHPEPCVLFGSVPNFPQPSIHNHESALLYGMTQYNGFQHHHPGRNLDSGVATTSNYYNPYNNPSVSRVFPLPIPINQGSQDQLPSSCNGGIVVVPNDDYRRNTHFTDGVRGSFKRENAKAIPGSFEYTNALAGSSSATVPLNTRSSETGVTPMNAESFPLMEVGSHRSRTVRNRSGAMGPDSLLAHNGNPLIPANYHGLALRTASFSNNGGDGGTLIWSQGPAIAHFQGSSVNGGCTEAGNMVAQGYKETTSSRSSTTFLHLPPVYHGHPNLHPLPQPMQGMRGQNVDFLPQVATSSHRAAIHSSSHTNGMEVGPRYGGPVPTTGIRIYRPRQRALIPEASVRHRNLPHLRVLPADEVAMMEISGYYEVGNSMDHHRDMRLDIDHMSYEELLALGEQIGNVTTGLSEETILSHLKTRTYISSATSMDLDEAACVDQETDSCVICQIDYKKQEKIGTLDCGHEYHVDCMKRWLIIKNTCPICKSTALTTKRKDLL